MKKNEKNIKPKEKKVNKHWGIVYGLIAFFVIGPIITIIVLTQPNNNSNQNNDSNQVSSNYPSSIDKGYINKTYPLARLNNGDSGNISFLDGGICIVDFHRFGGSTKVSGGTMYLAYLPEDCKYTDNDNTLTINTTTYFKEIYEYRDGLKQLHSQTISEQRVLPPSFKLEYNSERDTIKIITPGQFKLNGAEGYQKVYFVEGEVSDNNDIIDNNNNYEPNINNNDDTSTDEKTDIDYFNYSIIIESSYRRVEFDVYNRFEPYIKSVSVNGKNIPINEDGNNNGNLGYGLDILPKEGINTVSVVVEDYSGRKRTIKKEYDFEHDPLNVVFSEMDYACEVSLSSGLYPGMYNYFRKDRNTILDFEMPVLDVYLDGKLLEDSYNATSSGYYSTSETSARVVVPSGKHIITVKNIYGDEAKHEVNFPSDCS